MVILRGPLEPGLETSPRTEWEHAPQGDALPKDGSRKDSESEAEATATAPSSGGSRMTDVD